MSRLYRRRDRIKDDVQITQVLAHYGYRVHPENYEQQFPCDLHGDGLDIKPSGRVYPHTNSWYCFACDESRDVINTVMAKEGVEFPQAIKILEERYGLPDMPWEEGDYQTKEKPLAEQIEESSRGGSSFEDECRRVDRLLYNVAQERSLPPPTLLAFYEVYDRFVWTVEKEHCEVAVGREAMIKLRQRVMSKLETEPS